MTSFRLPEIPVIDVRDSGPADLARRGEAHMHDLFLQARRMLTPPILTAMDSVSRRWLDRAANPYRDEIAEIAALLGKPGVHALNTSYEWCCTSGVCNDPGNGVRLLRVLDWHQPGLGRNVVVAWQRGPAGDFANITWPGFVGTVTALAPGRFAAAINQPPMMSWGATLPFDWLFGRVKVWRSQALPPVHLLRQVFERCATYEAAKQMLSETPLCVPAFFVLAGTRRGEGCVIERTAEQAALREMPAAAANHWVTLPQRGRRDVASCERLAQMEAALMEASPWRTSPIINRDTRLVAEMNPANGTMTLQGWERNGPATATLCLKAH